MIGQDKNIEFIKKCFQENKTPRFILIQGEHGSGKKTLVQEISYITSYELVWFAPTVDGVRSLIDLCYTQTKPILYAISDCEKLSSAAMNALLKVAEEPPANTYIVLTFAADVLLPTIKSRGTLLIMEPYTDENKNKYAEEINVRDNVQEKIEIAENLGDLLLFENLDFALLYKFCSNIVDNIGNANVGSVLKISKKLKLKEKDDDSLFDVNGFIKVLLNKYYKVYKKTREIKYFKCWTKIASIKKHLSKTYHKQTVIDCMLLDLWSIWNIKEKR